MTEDELETLRRIAIIRRIAMEFKRQPIDLHAVNALLAELRPTEDEIREYYECGTTTSHRKN